MPNKRIKILIVDDEPDIVNALTHFILQKGYGALGALNGKEALRVLDKEKIDLILLDMKLPDIEGANIARIIKDTYPHTKILIITGHPEEAQGLAETSLFKSLMVKPIGIQGLYNKILEILREDISITSSLPQKQEIKARVLVMKAKLLFFEPSHTIYNLLYAHFKGCVRRGENYEVELACDATEMKEKLDTFNPEILIFNTAYLGSIDKRDIEEFSCPPHKTKEIIIYTIPPSGTLETKELKMLAKAVQTVSLKNGLIEIKRVTI